MTVITGEGAGADRSDSVQRRFARKNLFGWRIPNEKQFFYVSRISLTLTLNFGEVMKPSVICLNRCRLFIALLRESLIEPHGCHSRKRSAPGIPPKDEEGFRTSRND